MIGQAVTDQTEIGVVLAKGPPANLRAEGGGSIPNTTFAIPPGDPNYEGHARLTFGEPVELVFLQPHMHVRGKDMMVRLVYPSGESETLLSVPHYDFNWQLAYILAEPRKVPAGPRMDVTAWYDNSANNKYNPDPSQTVHWGDQTFQEMMIGFFNYKIPVDRPDPPKIERPTRTGAAQ